MRTPPKAILLDFYGTVVEEDDKYILEICKKVSTASPMEPKPDEVATRWGRAFKDMCFHSHGASFRRQREIGLISLDQVMSHYQADLNAEALTEPQFRYWKWPTLFPESVDVLDHLPAPVCLVSNIDDADLFSALDHVGLSFDRIVTSEGCRAYKPRTEMFRRALSLLGLPKEDVLHVGDSISSDVQGAAGVGIRALWVNRKQRPLPTDGPRPDHILGDLTGILDVLGQALRFPILRKLLPLLPSSDLSLGLLPPPPRLKMSAP